MKTSILFIVLVNTVTAYGQTDFSGVWKLNTDKSQFNSTPGAPAAIKLFVEQKGRIITFQRNDREKETVKIDSTAETEISTSTIKGSKTKISMKETPDKRGIIETRSYTYQEGEPGVLAARKTRTWSLSADKKILTINDYIETTKAGLNYDMVLIYDDSNALC